MPGDRDKVTYTYDPVTGDLDTKTMPHVGTTVYGHDDAGNLTSITDINGIVTSMTYDGRNRVLTTIHNGVTTSGRTYTQAGQLDTTSDAMGRTLDYDYTAEGLLEKITDPYGNFMYHAYDTRNRRIASSIHTAGAVETHYRGFDYGDPLTNPDLSPGKPWKIFHRNQDDTADLETVHSYDTAGKLDSVLDANIKLTAYDYDLFNRLIQVEQPGTVLTQYTYDAHGNLTSVTDAEGHITDYTYDDLGRLVETVSPDAGTTRYIYDEAGRMVDKIINGRTTSYVYDDLNRLTDILHADISEDVSYTYDSGSGTYLAGRLASMTDASAGFSYSYDAFGRLTSQTRVVDGISYTTGYGYDDAGALRAITYPTGQTIVYDADSTDPALVSAVRLNPAGANQTLASGLNYRPFGPMDGLTFGNGISLVKSFDKNYQIDTLAVSGIMSRDYTPDNVGNISEIADLLDATRSQSFSYDDLYRLTGASGVYGAVDFTYDKVGNRLTRTDAAGTDTYGYLAGTNKLRTVSGPNTKSYSYDPDGNVIAALGGIQPPLNDQAGYSYNANGQRTKSTADAGQAVVSHFDMAGRLIAETDTGGNLIKAYVWLHGQPLAMIVADGSVYYYHNDHLGTPQKMTDAGGNVVWAADYLPFGGADVIVGVVENDLRFAGQYYDQETGLHYNYHRYYDPKLGRYLRSDPAHQIHPVEKGVPYLVPLLIKSPQSLHSYTYVSNNPVNFFDPWGLFCKDDDERCKKIVEECRKDCLWIMLVDPENLPGTGKNYEQRFRRCVRECAEANNCFTY